VRSTTATQLEAFINCFQYSLKKPNNQFSFVVVAFCAPSGSSRWWSEAPMSACLRRGPRGYIFAVNAALMASQWHHREWTVSLKPPVNVKHGAGPQAPFSQTWVWLRPTGNRTRPAWSSMLFHYSKIRGIISDKNLPVNFFVAELGYRLASDSRTAPTGSCRRQQI